MVRLPHSVPHGDTWVQSRLLLGYELQKSKKWLDLHVDMAHPSRSTAPTQMCRDRLRNVLMTITTLRRSLTP